MKKIFILILFALVLTGCSSYMDKMHTQIAKEEAEIDYNSRPKLPSKFDEFRNPNLVYKNPKSRSIKNSKEYLPPVKRQYRPVGKKRYTVDDLADNETDGSLWSGAGQDNFLFARNSYKKSGDIVVIKVLQDLKDEIKIELARSTPQKPKKTKETEVESKPDSKDPKAAQIKPKVEKAKEPVDDSKADIAKSVEKTADGQAIYDKVSAMVIEEINKDHILIRGRKDVLFKTKKRTVEIQMLVTRKDISDDDSILSSKSLETSVTILR